MHLPPGQVGCFERHLPLRRRPQTWGPTYEASADATSVTARWHACSQTDSGFPSKCANWLRSPSRSAEREPDRARRLTVLAIWAAGTGERNRHIGIEQPPCAARHLTRR